MRVAFVSLWRIIRIHILLSLAHTIISEHYPEYFAFPHGVVF